MHKPRKSHEHVEEGHALTEICESVHRLTYLLHEIRQVLLGEMQAVRSHLAKPKVETDKVLRCCMALRALDIYQLEILRTNKAPVRLEGQIKLLRRAISELEVCHVICFTVLGGTHVDGLRDLVETVSCSIEHSVHATSESETKLSWKAGYWYAHNDHVCTVCVREFHMYVSTKLNGTTILAAWTESSVAVCIRARALLKYVLSGNGARQHSVRAPTYVRTSIVQRPVFC